MVWRTARASALLLCAAAWSAPGCAGGGERAAARQRLQEFVQVVNASPGQANGVTAAAHAAHVAGFFTDDVQIALGDGATPIHGREMLMHMILRLQPRTAEYQVALADVKAKIVAPGEAVEAELTAEFIRRTPGVSRTSMDAREFLVTMRFEDGEWRIARVTAVATLR